MLVVCSQWGCGVRRFKSCRSDFLEKLLKIIKSLFSKVFLLYLCCLDLLPMNQKNRKLAAIVFTDIVGFTKLTSEDQTAASELLKKQRELFQPKVKQFNGDWVKELGDGLLIIFNTATEAVKCCIELQKVSKGTSGLNIRIGIHLGEVLIENEDVIGDDVNIASRIEPFSAPGGIAISNKIFDAINREKEYETKYIGRPKLKGVRQKVEIFCISSHDLPETRISDVSAKLEILEKKSFKWNLYSLTGAALTLVGFLFWINLSFLGVGIASENNVPSISILIPDNLGDSVNDKWMNFLTENIIIDIANLGNVIVTPLRKVIKISKEELEMEDIASILDSDYLLFSNVYIEGEEFDMNSQLINTNSNKSVFGKKIKENIKNIPEASNQIASEILTKLGFKNDLKLAFEGKQERFNKAYEDGEYQKAIDIVNPAKKEEGLAVNVKGEFGFNRVTGTLTDSFYNLFNEALLPKIRLQPYDFSIDIHSSTEELPPKSIFKNNLDMTVAVARNMELFINNLNLDKNVYVYGMGDILPRAVDSIRAINPSWKTNMITKEFIDKYNITKKQKSSNNRITITLLGKSF